MDAQDRRLPLSVQTRCEAGRRPDARRTIAKVCSGSYTRCIVAGSPATTATKQLLDRFIARRDDTADEAFSELMRRHGPMVLGVCRRVLGDVA